MKRLNILRHVRDAMTDSQDKQKEQDEAKGRNCIRSYKGRDQVLIIAENLPASVVSVALDTNLRPRFIEPLTVVAQQGLEHQLKIPNNLCIHLLF